MHLFAYNKKELKNLSETAVKSLKYDGIFWISYPKKSSKIETDLCRDEGWEIMSDFGLRPVSAVSINETWSALRFRLEKIVGKLEIQKSDSNKEIIIPENFINALAQNKKAKENFDNLAYTYRKEYVRWIEDAKKQGHIRRDMATMDIVMAFDGIVMSVIDQMFFHKGAVTFNPQTKTDMVMRLFLAGVGV